MAPNRPQTSTEDWVIAGFDAVCEGGLAAVSIEAIAEQLGVSKAGFYHRFHDRQALLDAILEHWSSRADGHFERQAGVTDADSRLRAVTKAFISDEKLRGADAWLLLHDVHEPGFTERSRLVRKQTKDFGFEQLRRLGFEPDEAAARSHLLYTGYLGLVADIQSQPVPPTPTEARRLVDDLVDLVTAPSRPDRSDGES